MRGEEFLKAVAYIDAAWIEEAEDAQRKRAPLRKHIAAKAAGFLLAMGVFAVFAAWLFLPIRPQEGAAALRYVRVRDRLAAYESAPLTHYEEWTLEGCIGEPYGDGGALFRLKDTDTLSRLILRHADGACEMLRFLRFESCLTEEAADRLTETGLLTADDRERLRFGEAYTFGEVLEEIYGVHDAGAIVSVTWEKAEFDRSRIGKSVRVPTVVMRGEESVGRFYGILCGLVSASDDADPPARIFAESPAYREGVSPLSVQTDRRVTVRLKNGETITLEYVPTAGVLYQSYRALYVPLTDEDNRWLAEAVGIDTEWRDHGAESPPGGAETARPPEAGTAGGTTP